VGPGHTPVLARVPSLLRGCRLGPGEGTEAGRQGRGMEYAGLELGHIYSFVFTCVYMDVSGHDVHRIYRSPRRPI